jgi:ribosomal protein S18 acetylase RimI-like enzyme
MIKIIEVRKFEELNSIIHDLCQENKLTKEKTEERIQFYKDHFNNENSIYFIATVDKKTEGFMSFDITKKIIRTHRLFVKDCEENDALAFELISHTFNQLQSLEKEIFQIFFVKNFNLEQRLVENDFNVYHRVKMVYDLEENQIPAYSLDPTYQTANFTLDKLDEELQIIIDANKNSLDGEVFHQFSNMDLLKELFYDGKMDTDRLRSDSLILLKDNKIVGVNIVANLSESDAYIWVIALLEEHRGKGLGKYLMFKAHENCKNANVERINLDVTIENDAAYNLYKKLGYRETNRYLTVIKKY